ncbi:hypothetical protein [Uliginosibacterium sp. H1]|uniref:hypothetical protein n=1 Tax=Uliginosibacterium sp. H1 TaxID=3114757 RepID=UPI002E18F472|nr:hypothetical protein [Uliginosibacterium sp. H1]
MRRLAIFILLAMVSALAVTAVLHANYPVLQAAELLPDGEREKVALPWNFEEPAESRRLLVELPARDSQPAIWRIVPDDELRAIWVNDRFVSLDHIPKELLTNYWLGFHIDLSEYLEPGENRIVLQLTNHSGGGGLYVTPVPGLGAWIAMAAAFLPLLVGLGVLFRLRASQLLVLVLALVPLLAYWADTSWFERAHDTIGIQGHIGYVEWVATHLALPAPNAGWTYYHPPLYYIVGALAWKWAACFGIPAPETLQALSLALWLVFLAGSAGVLNMMLRDRAGLALLATAAIAAWPAGILHSVRLSNDAAYYAIAGAAAYYLVRWWRRQQGGDLWAFAVLTALGLLAKTNAIVLVAAGGLLLLWRVWHPQAGRRGRAFGQLVGFSLVAATGLALSLADNVYYYLQGLTPGWLVSNAGWLSPELKVPVDALHMLGMDVHTFLTQPWIRAYEDASGRGYFWNYLLRSSLSGEFDFPAPVQRDIALMWGWGLLALLVLGAVGAARGGWQALAGRSSTVYRHAPLILLGVLAIASLMSLRVQAPYAPSNDFRYVMPMLLPFLLLCVRSGRIACWLLAGFIVSSAWFFLVPV